MGKVVRAARVASVVIVVLALGACAAQSDQAVATSSPPTSAVSRPTTTIDRLPNARRQYSSAYDKYRDAFGQANEYRGGNGLISFQDFPSYCQAGDPAAGALARDLQAIAWPLAVRGEALNYAKALAADAVTAQRCTSAAWAVFAQDINERQFRSDDTGFHGEALELVLGF